MSITECANCQSAATQVRMRSLPGRYIFEYLCMCGSQISKLPDEIPVEREGVQQVAHNDQQLSIARDALATMVNQMIEDEPLYATGRLSVQVEIYEGTLQEPVVYFKH